MNMGLTSLADPGVGVGGGGRFRGLESTLWAAQRKAKTGTNRAP